MMYEITDQLFQKIIDLSDKVYPVFYETELEQRQKQSNSQPTSAEDKDDEIYALINQLETDTSEQTDEDISPALAKRPLSSDRLKRGDRIKLESVGAKIVIKTMVALKIVRDRYIKAINVAAQKALPEGQPVRSISRNAPTAGQIVPRFTKDKSPAHIQETETTPWSDPDPNKVSQNFANQLKKLLGER